MNTDRNTILFPRRRSEITHGRFVVDQHGMYFKFDHWLNPTSVYGVMLRLKQLEWLDSFDAIVCEDSSVMWELRKRVPKMAGRVISFYDYGDYSDEMPNPMGKVLYIADYSIHSDYLDIESVDELITVTFDLLWNVTELTSNYRKDAP